MDTMNLNNNNKDKGLKNTISINNTFTGSEKVDMHKQDLVISNRISNRLREVDMFPDVECHNGVVTIFIEWGDWKHEHGYLRYLMKQEGYEEINQIVTEEDGSDCYSAIHTFKKQTFPTYKN